MYIYTHIYHSGMSKFPTTGGQCLLSAWKVHFNCKIKNTLRKTSVTENIDSANNRGHKLRICFLMKG